MPTKILELTQALAQFFVSRTPSLVTEESTLHEISREYPSVKAFLESRYGVHVDRKNSGLSLKKLVTKYKLPSPQILFMEIQLDATGVQVPELTPKEAEQLILATPQLRILDARETWELKMGSVKNSTALNSEVLNDLLDEKEWAMPLLIYCHFGIRSKDVAAYLLQQGFTNVCIIKGGIDAWSQEVDPTVPRYMGAYC